MTHPCFHTTPVPCVDSSPLAAASRRHGRPSRLSLREAINAKCRECIHDPKSGTGNWRQQVTACTSRACPLYAVRPMSESAKEGME